MGRLLAVIGSGGKTMAMKLLGKQNAEQSVLLTTTTHIFPMAGPDCRVCLPDPTAQALAEALSVPGVVCAGTRAAEGKLGPLRPETLQRGIEAADLTVYEADGAKRLPLKLHREGEPVILPGTQSCLLVAGLSAWGQPVGEAVHRYELAAEWKKDPQQIVGSLEMQHCILETAAASGLPREQVKVYLNQADALVTANPAAELAAELTALGFDTWWGSLRTERRDILRWLQKRDSFGSSL